MYSAQPAHREMKEEEKQWKRGVLTLQLLSYLRSSLLLRFHISKPLAAILEDFYRWLFFCKHKIQRIILVTVYFHYTVYPMCRVSHQLHHCGWLNQALMGATQPCIQSGLGVSFGSAKDSPVAQKVFSPQTTIIKETSIELLTGHQELQAGLIMSPFIMNFLTMEVLYL